MKKIRLSRRKSASKLKGRLWNTRLSEYDRYLIEVTHGSMNVFINEVIRKEILKIEKRDMNKDQIAFLIDSFGNHFDKP